MKQTFELLPFPDEQSKRWTAISLTAEIQRPKNHIALIYTLEGNWSELVLPMSTDPPNRQHELWQSTCFECFFGQPGASHYWEVNLSPSGDWNVYRFSDYRADMTEEKAIQDLSCRTQQVSTTSWSLQCDVPLDGLDLASMPLELSITSVLQKKTGEMSYWSIQHAVSQPDFHQRRCFIVQI